MSNVNNAILVDYHKTLVDKEGNVCNDIVLLLQTLSKDFEIIVFTASILNKQEYKKLCSVLDEKKVRYKKFIYTKEAVGSDVETKLGLYYTVKSEYDVKFIIDNNKDVIKTFRKYGIYGLLAKEPKTYEYNK